MLLNSTQLHLGFAWDVYPFIALNLLFSLQAAYAAPLILLAQTRQADRDKLHSERVEKSHSRLEQAAKTETDKILELLQSNTDLTQQDKDLTEQVADLTKQIPRAPHQTARQVSPNRTEALRFAGLSNASSIRGPAPASRATKPLRVRSQPVRSFAASRRR